MEFSVRIFDPAGYDVSLPPALAFRPQRWSDSEYGGPLDAEIVVTGGEHDLGALLQVLYYEIHILNANNTVVWYGYVSEIDTLPNEQATLRAQGWWQMLDARYYQNLVGRVEAPDGNNENLMGWALTSSEIGFDADGDRLHSGENGLTALLRGTQVKVSGSTSNDGVWIVYAAASEESYELTSSAISFDAADDIRRSPGGLWLFPPGTLIEVSGSSSNDGWHLVEKTMPDRLEITPSYSTTIVNEAAGASVTLKRAQYVDLDSESVVNEQPGSSISLTAYGTRVAQKFTNDSGAAFTVARIGVKLRKVGAPTDNVVVELYTEGGGDPGSLLDSGTIAAADIGDSAAWEWATLSNTDSIAAGTEYFVVVRRAGANDEENCYAVTMDEDMAAGLDNVLVYDGSTYQQRDPQANLAFRVWGAVETTEQIVTMIEDNGQIFEAVEVVDDSGIETNQYRDGLSLTRAEVESLLSQGTSGGDALKAFVSETRGVLIEARPSDSDAMYVAPNGQGMTYSIRLADVINRVQVLYSYTDVNGNSVSEETAWATDDDSVERFGYRELRHTEADLDSAQAEALRDRILAERAWPAATVDLNDEQLRWRYGGIVEPGQLVAGQWVEIGDAPLSEAAMVITTPIYIAKSEYDAANGMLRITPAGAVDPWDMGMEQG